MDFIITTLKNQDQKLDEIKSMLLSQKSVLTFDEAAIYTGFSRSHLYKLTANGNIPHSKPRGKMIFFEKDILDKWLLQNSVTTSNEIETLASNYVTLQQKGGAK